MLLWLVLLTFCAVLSPIVALLCLCIYISAYRSCSRSTSKPCLGRSAAVVVLGDIGRSPRMCFHVESLANEGWKVAIVGYPGSALPPPLQRSSIKQHHLRTPPAWIARLPRAAFIAVAPFKLLLQAVSLFAELTTQVHPPPELVLVQTPPALPTLLVVKAAAALVKARVIIDWHNLAYTILALRLGGKSKLVRLAEWLERWSGRKAYAHLFVTEAMKNHLDLNWKLQGEKVVLHDRPPAHFRRATLAETHTLMGKLIPQIQPRIGDDWLPTYDFPQSTPFTKQDGKGELQWRDDRPALVVSSTSWTADEDFGLLLRAARLYEYRARVLADAPSSTSPVHSRSSTSESASALLSPTSASSAASTTSHFSYSDPADPIRTSKERRRPSIGALRTPTLPNEPATALPKLLIVVTGKGELRARYLAEIAHLECTERWRFVRIRTAWLETPDYPLLLGSADVGVSLHTSSSGLDLPMKVVDMLGCALPVCALDFACLGELVRERWNGVVFRDAEGLARQWESLLATHPLPNWLVTGGGLREPFEPPRVVEPVTAVGETRVAPPMSPNPSMTLLHSPGLAPGARFEAGGKRRRSTWAGNWKHVMRPLLDPKTPADTQDESHIDGYLSHSSALQLQPSTGGILQRRAASRNGYIPTALSDPDTVAGGSPSKSKKGSTLDYIGTEEIEAKTQARAGFGFVSQAAMLTHGESQKGLRQRKSVSGAAREDALGMSALVDVDEVGAKEDGIPAIQVSRPA
ncbi:related to ALG1-beta-mannosyltransferase [Sporisorium reilianum SRZ2]|uniref:Chitobiosyldiphosphodolichol beta-mannosyltransferase n=1 Tax=Sporisorium reilianum (strain SRZ2) TaxID=999809 RepID=E6ZPC4_SPORE|nr:related to ALG1-beta-mannosyltransferase [Sporisorium reilianum SRZ2]